MHPRTPFLWSLVIFSLLLAACGREKTADGEKAPAAARPQARRPARAGPSSSAPTSGASAAAAPSTSPSISIRASAISAIPGTTCAR